MSEELRATIELDDSKAVSALKRIGKAAKQALGPEGGSGSAEAFDAAQKAAAEQAAKLAREIGKINARAVFAEAKAASDEYRAAQERLIAAQQKLQSSFDAAPAAAVKASVEDLSAAQQRMQATQELSFSRIASGMAKTGLGMVTMANQALELGGKITRIVGTFYEFARAGAEAAGVSDRFETMEESVAKLGGSLQAAAAELLTATGALDAIALAAEASSAAIDGMRDGVRSALRATVEWAAGLAGFESVATTSDTALNRLAASIRRFNQEAADNALDKEAERVSRVGEAALFAKSMLDAGQGDAAWAAELMSQADAGKLADELQRLNPRIEELVEHTETLEQVRQNVLDYQAAGNKLTFDEMMGLQRLSDDLASAKGELKSLTDARAQGGSVLAAYGEATAKAGEASRVAAGKIKDEADQVNKLFGAFRAGLEQDYATRLREFGNGVAAEAKAAREKVLLATTGAFVSGASTSTAQGAEGKLAADAADAADLEEREKRARDALQRMEDATKQFAQSVRDSIGGSFVEAFDQVALQGASFRDTMTVIIGGLIEDIANAFAAWAATEIALLQGNPWLAAAAVVAMKLAGRTIASFGKRSGGGGGSSNNTANQAAKVAEKRQDRANQPLRIEVNLHGIPVPDRTAHELADAIGRAQKLRGY